MMDASELNNPDEMAELMELNIRRRDAERRRPRDEAEVMRTTIAATLCSLKMAEKTLKFCKAELARQARKYPDGYPTDEVAERLIDSFRKEEIRIAEEIESDISRLAICVRILDRIERQRRPKSE